MKKYLIRNVFVEENRDEFEPMHCQYPECEEENNALNNFTISMLKKFVFNIWLCDKHSNELRNLLKVRQ